MIFEKMHRFRKEGSGIKGIQHDKFTESKKVDMVDWNYMGYISEYEFIGYQAAMSDTSVVMLKRDLYNTKFNSNPVPKMKIDGFGGYHGGGLNTNCVVQFRKKDLIEMIKYMGDKDTLMVMNVDYCSETKEYLKEVKKGAENGIDICR